MGDLISGLLVGLFAPDPSTPGSEKAARVVAGFQLFVALLWLIGAGVLVFLGFRPHESDDRVFFFLGAALLLFLTGLFWFMARHTILDRRV